MTSRHTNDDACPNAKQHATAEEETLETLRPHEKNDLGLGTRPVSGNGCLQQKEYNHYIQNVSV
jgi:hypothetical protein